MKCSSCGKLFDYEKYYGICPKCGTYNKKETPQEAHERLHEAEDHEFKQSDMNAHLWGESAGTQGPTSWEQGSGSQTQNFNEYAGNENSWGQGTTEEQRIRRMKQSSLVFFLIAGIFVVVSIILIVVAAAVGNYSTPESSVTIEELQEPVTPVQKNYQEAFVVDRDTNIQLAFSNAEVLCNAGEEADFPEGEKLISVLVTGTGSDSDWDYDSDLFDPVGDIYIGYNNSFERSISSYDMEDYTAYTAGKTSFSASTLKYDSSTGYLYFFIPQDVNEVSFYVEQRDIHTNQVTSIYQVPVTLTIQEGM